jgi:putative nucleotidyltransferase with HDIG domain
MLERFTMVLANTIESRDAALQRHANRLVRLAGVVAADLGLSDEAATAVRYGACLHDIGKIAVPDALLRKPGALSREEQDVMRRHPEIGAKLLEDIDTWVDVRLIIRHHHERYDGAGYPDGVAGQAIPLGARIVAAVDAFDVMRNGRPYAAAKPYEAILAELRRERGSQFDPDVVDALLGVVSEDV